MSLTPLCEIDFYIDGELGPEEASELEAQLESDLRARALFDAVWRHKEVLTQALEALDMPSAANGHTSELQAKLAQVLACRITQTQPPQPERLV
jgi:anti-sigma factor RsiW